MAKFILIFFCNLFYVCSKSVSLRPLWLMAGSHDLRTSPICNLDKVSVLIYSDWSGLIRSDSDWSDPKLINEKYKMLSLISKLVIVASRCKFALGDYQVWTIIFAVKIILLAVRVSGDKNSIFFLRETVQIFVGVSLYLYINQGKRFER